MSVKKPKGALPRKPRRSRASTKKVPKTRAVKAPPVRRTVRLGILCAIVVIVSLLIAWRRIDAKVARRLSSFETPSVPVIYSAPLDLRSVVARSREEGGTSRDLLRSILTDRRYTEVASTPSRPGEFSLTNEELAVFTRDFTTAAGTIARSQRIKLPLEGTDTLPPAQGQRALLEPQIISHIGAQEMRASRFVSLDLIPEVVQHAVISIEDERFYSHFGIDLFGVLRAASRNIVAGRLVQGGSTLTQQLAKNLFLSPKRTIWRKLLEIPTALSLERHLSKKQLLELYLNEIYLGQEGSVSIHGMPQAATTIFGKNISDISAAEAATLAGIIKAPSYFNPRKHPERAKERRNTVLAKMRELGHLSEKDYATALQRPLQVAQQQEHRRIAPYFTTALESELSEALDLESAPSTGLAVYTGLDLGMQRCAEDAIAQGIAALEKTHPRLKAHGKELQGALVALEPFSGLVRAWVGGRDYSESQFNRVNLAVRQIGSTVKPFVYLTALDSSLNSYKTATVVSVLEDQPMEIQQDHQPVWSPENYDHEYRGDVTLRYALENSLNMPALYIAERIGLSALKRTLSDFKIAPSVHEVPSIALGALDSTLLRLTSAYGALANSGIYIQPRLYLSALDGSNDRLAMADLAEERVADENASFVLTTILEGVIDRGTGKGARAKGFTRPAAGKTGTSDSARDAWFIGYTPTLVAGVWVGFDDNTPINITGGAAAAPLWGQFLKCSSPFMPLGDFSPPPGVSFVEVDTKTGEVATSGCPREQVANEAFVRGTEPSRRCSLHGAGDSPSDLSPPPDTAPNSRDRSGFWTSIFGQ